MSESQPSSAVVSLPTVPREGKGKALPERTLTCSLTLSLTRGFSNALAARVRINSYVRSDALLEHRVLDERRWAYQAGGGNRAL